MKASIVIRAKNEAALPLTLALARRQTCACEVVVVDSGSSDESLSILASHKWVKRVRIAAEEFTYGRALNLGFRHATGDVVIVLSAHAYPSDDRWAENLLRHFADPTVAAVYGRQQPHADAWVPVRRDVLEFYGADSRIQSNPLDPGDHRFSNANAAIRRQCWQLRGFDEGLPYCEDWEWARFILGLGWKIVYDAQAAVHHSHNESLCQVYTRGANEKAAQTIIYGDLGYGRFHWLYRWLHAVRSDARFALNHPESKCSLSWMTIYRLFWACGRFAGRRVDDGSRNYGAGLVPGVERESDRRLGR